MLRAAGFRPDPVRQLRHSDWLRASARLACQERTSGPFSRVLQWKPVAKTAAWMCYALGAADCMVCVAERPG
jgi:hypothetical protein